MVAISKHPRVSLWQQAQVALLVGNLGWTTFCLGGYRPGTMVIAWLLAGLLFGVHFAERVFTGGAMPRWHPAGWYFVPFLLYTAANVWFVTPYRWLGWRDAGEWLLLIGTFWVLLNGIRDSRARWCLFWSLVAIAAVSGCAAFYQHWGDAGWLMLGRRQADQFLGRASGTFGIPNSLAALIILLLPGLVALVLERRVRPLARGAALVTAVILALALMLTISRGAWLGLSAAVLIWPFVPQGWSWRRRFSVVAIVLGALFVAGGAAYASSPRIRERLREFRVDSGERSRPILWRAALQIFREHPIFGSGAGSYNLLFDKFRPENFRDEPQWAHSDYLNTASDYGGVGFVLLFGAVIAAAAGAARRGGKYIAHIASSGAARLGVAAAWGEIPRSLRVGCLIGLTAFAFHIAVDFHWKIPALALASATMAGLLVGSTWQLGLVTVPHTMGWRMGALVALAGSVFLAGSSARQFAAEARRYEARESIDAWAARSPDSSEYHAAILAAANELRAAVRWDAENANAWADLSAAISMQAYFRGADIRALGVNAADSAAQALRISDRVAEFWWRRGIALDMQGRWFEAGAAFTRATGASPNSSKAWYYYAYHSSLDPRGHELATNALDVSLRLDPGNSAALALRQRLALSSDSHNTSSP